ncbi:hypothetical protein RclHR1_03450008 [Rhizophagus clarus]|uniref:Uncharacterized protein n=1 Tax=Rhizophagus clarus TaxID=94130 RepID=A0A2Z6RAR8_9GLOM|nr:hypothetical protein RclHR1_03450008 [Rhizophagus clarus]GES74343.1 hypothetical protein RCL_jg9938.t1 [Rhizophagus clarus]
MNTKFAITIFILLAYIVTITQAIGIKNGGGYLTEFQEKHSRLMGDLRNTIDELDHRMEVFKKRVKHYHDVQAQF